MPSEILPFIASVYRSVSDLPRSVWKAFHANPQNANIMYAHAYKSRKQGQSSSKHDLWIVLTNNSDGSIEFILSCTEGPLGSYPVFIFTTLSPALLYPAYVFPALFKLAQTLRSVVPIERVFSIFAHDTVAKVFSQLWTQLTGVENYIAEPYYAATFTYCTKETFSDKPATAHPDFAYELRRAVESDVPEVAELCFGFANASPPFTLTRASAKIEAMHLVRNRQLWIHHARKHWDNDTPPSIASIVAVTRETEEVAAITKVYTSPDWRRGGCAERLVRYVCKELLATKKSVVLYVAHDNARAAGVYHRIGFVGLEDDKATQGVSDWLEVGFDRRVVRLGHW